MKLRLNLGARITLVLVLMLMLSLGLTQRLVDRQNILNATANIETDLQVAREVLVELLSSRSASLLDIVRPATRDHAFRMAYSSDHVPTLESAMRNLMGRINLIPTDLMMLTDLDGGLIASQSTVADLPDHRSVQWLIDRAFNSPTYEATGVVLVGSVPHQMVITPMLVPAPDAWILIGFPIDEGFLDSTGAITRKGVSVLVSTGDEAARVVRSDLVESEQAALVQSFQMAQLDMAAIHHVEQSRNRQLALFVALESPPGQGISIALHDSLSMALEPWRQLNRTLAVIFAGALGVSLLVAVFMGQSLSAPIRRLTDSVKLIASGQYESRVSVKSADEVGQLGAAFNDMAKGLQEREKVRSLLGKVVSEEIAHELLNNELELGGEQRELTVLFCDVRDFTKLCEGAEPAKILQLLNDYFSGASDIIERNGGVVDKYMGDAIMALFGAPVRSDQHPRSAVNALMELRAYAEQRSSEKARFTVGLGVASGVGVVGNMGSENRLNYTVIGDCVNLAARLESLTRFYGIDALVSAATAKANPAILFRLIDRVQVKGKSISQDIFQPLAADYSAQRLTDHQAAMEQYLEGDWSLALAGFRELAAQSDEAPLYQVFIARCEQLIAQQPRNWDGVHRFTQK